MKFEWDADKAKLNLIKHGISFEECLEVFDDSFALDLFDKEHSDFEKRFNIIGSTNNGVLFVVYTVLENEIIRIISARHSTSVEKDEYYEK